MVYCIKGRITLHRKDGIIVNETLRLISTRYSCRAFTGEMPTEDQLAAIAKAAVEAPSGVNRQAWRVIVVKNRELIADMEAEGMRVLAAMEDQTMYNRIMERGGTIYYHAPCMIMVPIAATDGAQLDCGILCQNVVLAAESLGLNSLICGMAGLAFSEGKAKEFKERLGFPEGYEFGIAILLGHSAAKREPHEPDMSKISIVE